MLIKTLLLFPYVQTPPYVCRPYRTPTKRQRFTHLYLIQVLSPYPTSRLYLRNVCVHLPKWIPLTHHFVLLDLHSRLLKVVTPNPPQLSRSFTPTLPSRSLTSLLFTNVVDLVSLSHIVLLPPKQNHSLTTLQLTLLQMSRKVFKSFPLQ